MHRFSPWRPLRSWRLPRRPRVPPGERERLLRFLARRLTREQYARAERVEDVEALRYIAEPYRAQA